MQSRSRAIVGGRQAVFPVALLRGACDALMMVEQFLGAMRLSAPSIEPTCRPGRLGRAKIADIVAFHNQW